MLLPTVALLCCAADADETMTGGVDCDDSSTAGFAGCDLDGEAAVTEPADKFAALALGIGIVADQI